MRRPAGGWAALLGLVAAAGVLVGVWSGAGLLLGSRTSATERGWLRDVEPGRSSAVTEAAKVLSTIGSAAVLIPVTLVVALSLVLRRLVGIAGFLVTALVGGIELPNVVKAIVGRPRPPVADRLVSVASTSFPSGHAAQNAAILPALALAAAALGANRRISLGLAIALAVLVGLSRSFLGVHYPSDVLAGWLFGAAWFAACLYAFPARAVTFRREI